MSQLVLFCGWPRKAFAVAHGPGHSHPSIEAQYIPSHLLVVGESTNCGKPTQHETERSAVSKLIESRCHTSLQFGWMQRRRSLSRIGKLHESLACPSCTEPPSRPPPSSLLRCGWSVCLYVVKSGLQLITATECRTLDVVCCVAVLCLYLGPVEFHSIGSYMYQL